MKKNKDIIRVGDIVRHGRKKYVVARTRSWLHRNGERLDLVRSLGEIPLLVDGTEVKLIKKREDTPKEWWKVFPEGEK